MSRARCVFQILLWILPWPLRRAYFRRVMGYSIHPTAKVGFSYISANRLEMGEKAYIGHGTYVGKLDRLVMGENCIIGNLNWITGLPTTEPTPFFAKFARRKSELVMEENSAIMHRHIVDCTDSITFEKYAGLAGYRSQLLTHGIDPIWCQQACAPIRICAYSMVGSGSILIKGAIVPDRSIVAAGSVVAKLPRDNFMLYGGNPCVQVRKLPTTSGYFHREGSIVY